MRNSSTMNLQSRGLQLTNLLPSATDKSPSLSLSLSLSRRGKGHTLSLSLSLSLPAVLTSLCNAILVIVLYIMGLFSQGGHCWSPAPCSSIIGLNRQHLNSPSPEITAMLGISSALSKSPTSYVHMLCSGSRGTCSPGSKHDDWRCTAGHQFAACVQKLFLTLKLQSWQKSTSHMECFGK